MRGKPVQPTYTCDNCRWGDATGVVPCVKCPVTDKPTEMPRKWEPKVDLTKWSPTATKPEGN